MIDKLRVEYDEAEEASKAECGSDAEKAKFAACADWATYALEAEEADFAEEVMGAHEAGDETVATDGDIVMSN